jgi:hypothetical protein
MCSALIGIIWVIEIVMVSLQKLIEAIRPSASLPASLSGPLSRCGTCRHRQSDRQVLEQTIPGLLSFSSGFGASVADSRLCLHHDRLVSPGDVCAAHQS